MWELQVKFYLGKMKTIAWESAFQIALRNYSKEAGGTVSIYMLLVKGEYMQSSTDLFFVHGRFLLVVRTVIAIKDFSAFLDMRRYKNWTHKMDSWKCLTIWRPVLPVPHPPPEQDRVPHFCSLPWTPFRRCWKSAASAAHDLILVAVDSEWVKVAQLCPTLCDLIDYTCIGEGNGNPLQSSCLENPRDGGAWWAAVYGVAQSWTWLKQLSRAESRDYTVHGILQARILEWVPFPSQGDFLRDWTQVSRIAGGFFTSLSQKGEVDGKHQFVVDKYIKQILMLT